MPGIGEDLEGQALQAVAGEYGAGFVEGLVGGRLAAAQVVVVHRRQIVMHQRVGVDQFDRASRRIGLRRFAAQGLAGGIHQQRAHPLAAVEHAVAHGLVEARQFRPGWFEQAFQRRIDAALALRLVGRDHAWRSASKGASSSSPSRSMRICTFCSA
ncbi:hypothetical protein D3C72_1755270 [compost metagenome]